MQRYLTFFDRDDDSRVSLFDSFVAFHDLGFNTLFSFLIATSMHMAMSLPTSLATRGRIDPFLAIYIGTVVKALVRIFFTYLRVLFQAKVAEVAAPTLGAYLVRCRRSIPRRGL